MKTIPHRFKIGDAVCFINSIDKKRGTVLALDRSYGWPTYRIEIDGELWTLCENDLIRA